MANNKMWFDWLIYLKVIIVFMQESVKCCKIILCFHQTVKDGGGLQHAQGVRRVASRKSCPSITAERHPRLERYPLILSYSIKPVLADTHTNTQVYTRIDLVSLHLLCLVSEYWFSECTCRHAEMLWNWIPLRPVTADEYGDLQPVLSGRRSLLTCSFE